MSFSTLENSVLPQALAAGGAPGVAGAGVSDAAENSIG